MTSLQVYLRCLRWGLLTGAVAGSGTAVIAAFAGDLEGLERRRISSRLWQAVLAPLYGAPAGMLFALLPTLIGGLIILSMLWASHPQPASPEAVYRDLRVGVYGFAALVAALPLFAVLLAGGASWLADSFVYLLVIAACSAVVLWRAPRSIASAWAGEPSSPASFRRVRGPVAEG